MSDEDNASLLCEIRFAQRANGKISIHPPSYHSEYDSVYLDDNQEIAILNILSVYLDEDQYNAVLAILRLHLNIDFHPVKGINVSIKKELNPVD